MDLNDKDDGYRNHKPRIARDVVTELKSRTCEIALCVVSCWRGGVCVLHVRRRKSVFAPIESRWFECALTLKALKAQRKMKKQKNDVRNTEPPVIIHSHCLTFTIQPCLAISWRASRDMSYSSFCLSPPSLRSLFLSLLSSIHTNTHNTQHSRPLS